MKLWLKYVVSFDKLLFHVSYSVCIYVDVVGCHYSLDWTTGLKFFPFLDKLSIWFLKIFDTWRSQFFFKTILEQSYNCMTVANMQIHKYTYLHIENNWLAVDMDLPILK